MIERIYTIDYLRGILAFSIMVYHYISLSHIDILTPSSILSKISFYGVSLFFVISGFSLTINYLYKFKSLDINILKRYLIKRIIRIYPLFWLIIIFYFFVLYFGHKSFPSILDIFLNFTLLFGFYDASIGMTMGSWSISIEIVFYILFPFLILSINIYPKPTLVFMFLSILISIYISSFEMYSLDRKDYWDIYLNLINHLYFFIVGILVAYIYLKNKKIFKVNYYLSLISICIITLIFYLYPVGNFIYDLVDGTNRIILSLLLFVLFISILSYNSHIKKDNIINKVFDHFGEISYTLYLLHPIVYRFFYYIFNFLDIDISIYIKILIMSIFTIIFSTLIHKYYEMKLKNYLGKLFNASK